MNPAVPTPVDGRAAWQGIAGFGSIEQSLAPRYGKLALLVLLLALATRAAVAVLLTDLDPDTANLWEYGKFAIYALKHGALVREVLGPDGGTYVCPTAFMPPLSVFLWMGVFWLFGVTKTALAVMTAFNVVCGVAIVHCVMRIARTLFYSGAIALVAGLFTALHPVFIYSVATYHAVNLYLLLLLLIFDLCSTRFSPSSGRAVTVGLLLGLATLERTEYLILGGAILLGALWSHRKLRITAISVIVAAAVVLPWTARNYVVLHRFIPVANSAGYNLFKGFNPEANGSGHWEDRNDVQGRLLGARLAQVPMTPMFENDVNDIYKAAAQQFIREQPVRAFVELPIRKILLFWLFDIYDPETHRLLYQLSFWPLSVLAIVGLWRSRSAGVLKTPDHRTILVVFAVQTVVMASYAVHLRYRMNVEPFLFCYAALGSWAALAWLGKTRRPAP